MTRAAVFGFGDVGVGCLAALLARGVAVPLVVTHRVDDGERDWQRSLESFARERDIEVLIYEGHAHEVARRVDACTPDFLFSFYFRRMIDPSVLRCASRGAFNLHGSLLPKFRGRAPVNWSILRGEKITGVTLHYMTSVPDAGDIVAQRSFPILPDDTALDVFRKVCVFGETLVYDMVPLLEAGTAPRVPQDPVAGNYVGKRTPADGRIDWWSSAQHIHDLVRAVAPPFPGALTLWADKPARVLRTLLVPSGSGEFRGPTAFAVGERSFAQCGDARLIRLLEVEIDGVALREKELAIRLSRRPLRLAGENPREARAEN